MKLNLLLLVMGSLSLASRYAIDKSCDNTDKITLRDGAIRAMEEAHDLADNAFQIMTNHAADDKVQAMFKLIFGEDDYDNKFNAVRDTFAAVREFDPVPSQFRPQDDGWIKMPRSRFHVELYCSKSRIGTKVKTNPVTGEVEERPYSYSMERQILSVIEAGFKRCYDEKLEDGVTSRPMLRTLSSDDTNIQAWRAAGGIRVSKAPYTRHTPYANEIDLCPWYTSQMAAGGWAKIDAAMVEKAKSEEFIKALRDSQAPIDGLQTFGCAMLHELTHTNQGGLLIDDTTNGLPGGTRGCYGWRCVRALRNVRNSDSINMMGIALKVWSLGHWVNENGEIISL